MNSSAIGRGREWIGTKGAAERLGCPAQAVNRLARAGYLTLRTLPGCDPLYLASDVERLARESTRYATGAVTSVAVDGEQKEKGPGVTAPGPFSDSRW